MGAHFSAVELDNAIRFSTLFRMSEFLWHSSKWARRFGCFLQYKSELEVLACGLDTDINYVTTMLQLWPSLNHYPPGIYLLNITIETLKTVWNMFKVNNKDTWTTSMKSFNFEHVITSSVSKVAATFRRKMWKLWVYSHRQIGYPSSVLSWTRVPLLNFQQNALKSLPEISKIPGWLSFGFGIFVLSLYIWSKCYLLDFEL